MPKSTVERKSWRPSVWMVGCMTGVAFTVLAASARVIATMPVGFLMELISGSIPVFIIGGIMGTVVTALIRGFSSLAAKRRSNAEARADDEEHA